MTRIKYRLKSNGLYDTENILTGSGYVFATITNGNQYTITSFETGSVLYKGEEKTNALTKKKVKSILRTMGAVFSDEVRLSKRDSKLMSDTLDNPPEPNEALKALFSNENKIKEKK